MIKFDCAIKYAETGIWSIIEEQLLNKEIKKKLKAKRKRSKQNC
jgi:hypothetical protein